MKKHMTIFATVFGLGLLAAAPAFAFGSPADESDMAFTTAVAAVKAKDYTKAVDLLKGIVSSDPRNADAYNYLAYSQRNLGQLDESMKNYNAALAIKPEHKGALEYQGELFLMLNNPESAEANLQKLKQICRSGCDEKTALETALTRYKESKSSSIGQKRVYSMNY